MLQQDQAVEYVQVSPNPNGGKAKVPSAKVLSDDCAVRLGMVIEGGEIVDEGTSIFPHVGEWVEILTVTTIGEWISVSKLAGMADEEDSAKLMGAHFENLCRSLSKRVISWNWTDMVGDVMEQPHKRPDVLAMLTAEEVIYLAGLSQSQDSPEMRKNGSATSDFGSSEGVLPTLTDQSTPQARLS